MEQGAHEELLALEGVYKDLVKRQLDPDGYNGSNKILEESSISNKKDD